jgi:hypothetical protein
VIIQLLHVPDCPHVEQARQLLHDCLRDLDMTSVAVVDREGNFPSPSILVNGVDVMGAQSMDSPSCRLDVPTRERIMSALNPAGDSK